MSQDWVALSELCQKLEGHWLGVRVPLADLEPLRALLYNIPQTDPDWRTEMETVAAKLIKQLTDAIAKCFRSLAASYGYTIEHWPDKSAAKDECDGDLNESLIFDLNVLCLVLEGIGLDLCQPFAEPIENTVYLVHAVIETLGSDVIEMPEKVHQLLALHKCSGIKPRLLRVGSDDDVITISSSPDCVILRLLDRNQGTNFDIGALESLHTMQPLLNKLIYAQRMIETISDAHQMVDIRVRSVYISLFKITFQQLTRSDRIQAMNIFYNKYGAVNWQKHYEKYSQELHHASGRITDHSSMGQEQVLDLCDQFSWFLLISAKATLWHLLTLCIDVNSPIPTVVKILRHLSPVCALRDAESGQPLILTALKRLITKFNLHEDAEQAERFLLLVGGLTRDKPAKVSKDGTETPGETAALAPILVLREICVSQLQTATHSKLALQLLKRLLANRDTNVQWAMQPREITMWEGLPDTATGSELDAATMLVALGSMCQWNLRPLDSKVSSEMGALALETIAAMAQRLTDADLHFSALTCDWLEQRLASCEWQLKFCIVSWLKNAFSLATVPEAWKPQAPECLVRCLPMPVAAGLQMISCSYHSQEDCLFRSLFELSLVSVDAVKTLLERGLAIPLHRDLLCEKIACVLADFLPKYSVEIWRNFLALLRLMVEKLDPAREIHLLTSVSEAALKALHDVNPVLLLGDAVVVSLGVNKCVRLVDNYCRLCKDQADSAMSKLSSAQQPVCSGPDPNLEAVTALTQLYLQACLISSVITADRSDNEPKMEIPSSLKVLLVSLTKYSEQIHQSLVHWSGWFEPETDLDSNPVTTVESEHLLEELRYPGALYDHPSSVVKQKEAAYRKLMQDSDRRLTNDSRDDSSGVHTQDEWDLGRSTSLTFTAKGFGIDQQVPSAQQDSQSRPSREDLQRKRDMADQRARAEWPLLPQQTQARMPPAFHRYSVLRAKARKDEYARARTVWPAAARTLEPQTRALVESRMVPTRRASDAATHHAAQQGAPPPFRSQGQQGYNEGLPRHRAGRHAAGKKAYRRK